MMFCEEAIDCFAAEPIEIVWCLDLNYFYLIALAVEIVDSLDRGKFFLRNVACPVSGGRDQKHWFRREHGRNFDIACVDSKAWRVLAQISALHDCGHHVHWRSELQAIINRSQQKCLGAAAGCACDAQLICIHVIE